METGREKSRRVNVLVIKGEERGSPASEAAGRGPSPAGRGGDRLLSLEGTVLVEGWEGMLAGLGVGGWRWVP